MKVREVRFVVRHTGESVIVFHGLIARAFSSEHEASDAALFKAREWIDDQLARD